MNAYELPAGAVGAGSQPAEADGAALDYTPMPDEMATYRMPDLPEPEQLLSLDHARWALQQLQARLNDYDPTQRALIDLGTLDTDNRRLIDQVLGEGEVSIRLDDDELMQIQESVLAGVWRVTSRDRRGRLLRDWIEVGDVPLLVRQRAFADARERVEPVAAGALPEGVLNAPPLVAELNDKIAAYQPGMPPHVINLTLLPQTEQDIAYLAEQLGRGPLTILSRGYGNCRISATASRHVWWVQYFNSQDNNILNTLEVSEVPSVACAASEDIADSAERLAEIMEVYR